MNTLDQVIEIPKINEQTASITHHSISKIEGAKQIVNILRYF